MAQYSQAPDWQQLKRIGDERLSKIGSLEGFYVLWPRQASGWTMYLLEFFASRTYLADPRFLGFCVFGSSPPATHGSSPPRPEPESAISLMGFMRLHQRNPRIGLMDFLARLPNGRYGVN